MSKRKVINITAYCTGIKKRCRKSEFHSVKVAEGIEVSDFNHDKAVENSFFAVFNSMKQIDKNRPVIMSIQEADLEEENGFSIMTFRLFSDRKTDISHLFKSV